MSTVGLEGIEHSVQQTHLWINALARQLGWENKGRALRLLKAVLHAVRDHLSVNEVAQLGAQLPTVLRGYYYEQWRPEITPVRERRLDTFLERVAQAFERDPLPDLPAAVAIVFAVMTDKVSMGEIADVHQSLPAEIRQLWDLPDVGPGGRH